MAGKNEMTHITEIIPDDMPEWAIEAMASGQFFRVCLERVEALQALLDSVSTGKSNEGRNRRSAAASRDIEENRA